VGEKGEEMAFVKALIASLLLSLIVLHLVQAQVRRDKL